MNLLGRVLSIARLPETVQPLADMGQGAVKRPASRIVQWIVYNQFKGTSCPFIGRWDNLSFRSNTK
jgi:hypothetical protein